LQKSREVIKKAVANLIRCVADQKPNAPLDFGKDCQKMVNGGCVVRSTKRQDILVKMKLSLNHFSLIVRGVNLSPLSQYFSIAKL